MAEPFVLEQRRNLKWVIDPPADPYGDGCCQSARTGFQAPGLAAETTVMLDPYREAPLQDFFAGLAADWRGWAGTRGWTALEHEMTIEARHDGRANVVIAVTLRRPEQAFADDAWSARAVFTVEAGEELTAVARDLASLLAR